MTQIDSSKRTIAAFTDLFAWQEGHKLVLKVYAIADELPKTEKFNLTDQLQRAAVSVTNNIAEGFARKSNKEEKQFLYIALGSLKEVQNMLILCRDLGYISESKYGEIDVQSATVSRLLRGLIKSCK